MSASPTPTVRPSYIFISVPNVPDGTYVPLDPTTTTTGVTTSYTVKGIAGIPDGTYVLLNNSTGPCTPPRKRNGFLRFLKWLLILLLLAGIGFGVFYVIKTGKLEQWTKFKTPAVENPNPDTNKPVTAAPAPAGPTFTSEIIPGIKATVSGKVQVYDKRNDAAANTSTVSFHIDTKTTVTMNSTSTTEFKYSRKDASGKWIDMTLTAGGSQTFDLEASPPQIKWKTKAD